MSRLLLRFPYCTTSAFFVLVLYTPAQKKESDNTGIPLASSSSICAYHIIFFDLRSLLLSRIQQRTLICPSYDDLHVYGHVYASSRSPACISLNTKRTMATDCCERHSKELRQLVLTLKLVIDRSRTVLDLLLQMYDDNANIVPPSPTPSQTIEDIVKQCEQLSRRMRALEELIKPQDEPTPQLRRTRRRKRIAQAATR